MLNVWRLEGRIEAEMRAAGVPSLALAVVQGEEVIYARGFGTTSVEGGPAVTPDTIFRIGSTTKPLVGTAIMRLVESGRLDLDRPVREYVPWLQLDDAEATQRLTLRMLLSQTTGLATEYELYGPRDPDALERSLRRELPALPRVAPPGLLFTYSNPGVRLAGYILQVAMGKPFAEAMRELLFEPLGMTRTTFDPLVAMTYPLALPHEKDAGGHVRVVHRFPENAARYPAGLAMSTVLDLARFAILHLGGGQLRGEPILSPETVALMHTPQSASYHFPFTSYGLTFFISDYKGTRRVDHGGGHSSYQSLFILAPDAGLAVILLHNLLPTFDRQAKAVADTLFDELLDLPAQKPQPQAVEPDRSRWPLLTGSYLGITCGLATVESGDGELILFRNGTRYRLQAVRPDLYVAVDEESGDVLSLGFVLEGEAPAEYAVFEGQVCRRFQPDPDFVPHPERWTAYTGAYRLPFGDLIVGLQDGRLELHLASTGDDMACIPLSDRCFACNLGTLEFEVQPDGSVPSLTCAGTLVARRVETV